MTPLSLIRKYRFRKAIEQARLRKMHRIFAIQFSEESREISKDNCKCVEWYGNMLAFGLAIEELQIAIHMGDIYNLSYRRRRYEYWGDVGINITHVGT